jgi:hypothetical protein
VTETHQVAEAQQEKNARLREAFGISEYFVDGSSFDPDREAKEKIARSNAIQEKEKQKALESAKEKEKEKEPERYELVHTPSPEPVPPEVKSVKKKKRKRKERCVKFFFLSHCFQIDFFAALPVKNPKRRRSRRSEKKKGNFWTVGWFFVS